MTNSIRSNHQMRSVVAFWACLIVLVAGLIRPTLGKHHYGEFYRATGYCHGPNRHLTLDVANSAPDLQPLDLGWTAAPAAVPVARLTDHWHALDPIVDEAPPGSVLHRKIGSARTDDPDLVA